MFSHDAIALSDTILLGGVFGGILAACVVGLVLILAPASPFPDPTAVIFLRVLVADTILGFTIGVAFGMWDLSRIK